VTGAASDVKALYRARKGRVEFVDVPTLQYVTAAGEGDPNHADFARAIEALYAVSYGAHFVLKKERDVTTKVMPLEALWWVDDRRQQDLVAAVALGFADMSTTDRQKWHWQAMIMQPAPIDESTVARAVEQSRKKDLPTLDEVRFELWKEGRSAQVLHIGPYAEEAPTIALLHDAIEAAGCRPRGRHHEIYLSDPRRSAPERLRTILRHPVEPA
jgi:hypothetical protein